MCPQPRPLGRGRLQACGGCHRSNRPPRVWTDDDGQARAAAVGLVRGAQHYDFAAGWQRGTAWCYRSAGMIGRRGMAGITTTHLLSLASAASAALLLSLTLIVLLRPSLRRFALAHPNARSSHRKPTPQGGGIAVVVATFAVAWAAVALEPQVLRDQILRDQSSQFLTLTAAAAVLGLVGMIDDMRSLPAALRLMAQCIAVAAVIATFPHELRLLPQFPWAVERACPRQDRPRELHKHPFPRDVPR
jgi:hypothetical protein